MSSHSDRNLIVAVDARLYGRDATGDSTYWTGLLDAMTQVSCPERLVLFTDSDNCRSLEGRCEIVPLTAKHPRKWSAFAFPRAARDLGADILHTQYNLPFLGTMHGVTTIHDVSFMIGPQWFRFKDRFLLQKLIPLTIQRADAVITVSETSKRELEQFFPHARGKTSAIFNGPNTRLSPIEPAQAKRIVQERFGLTGPYLLTVASKWPRKNLQLAVDAAAEMSPPATLVMVGKTLQDDLELTPNVVSTGYVTEEELAALYSFASLYVCPSWHEGFGIPLLEAWSYGCPVVCSVGGALPEIAGNAALVIESWDPYDWARAIESLLADSGKLEELRKRGEERLQRFSWKRAALETLEVYRKCLNST